MAEFEVAGVHYRTNKMGLLDAAHVARKLAPIYGKVLLVRADLAPLLDGINAERDPEGSEAGKVSADLFNRILGAADRLLLPILEELAAVPREDFDSVVGLCLGTCLRQQGATWAPVWNAAARAPQFQDTDLAVMVRIVWNVVAEQLGPFFLAPVSPLSPGAAAPNGLTVQ